MYVSDVVWENGVHFGPGELELTAGPFFSGKVTDCRSPPQTRAVSSSFSQPQMARADAQDSPGKRSLILFRLCCFFRRCQASFIWQSEVALLTGTGLKSNCDWN